MTQKTLNDLKDLTDIVYRGEQASLKKIITQEQELRAEIAKLEERHNAVIRTHGLDVSGTRSYGGDVLWQGWVERSRSDLQIRLAQVMARKSDFIRRLSLAHGRKEAAARLVDENRSKRAFEHAKKRIDADAALCVLVASEDPDVTNLDVLTSQIRDQHGTD